MHKKKHNLHDGANIMLKNGHFACDLIDQKDYPGRPFCFKSTKLATVGLDDQTLSLPAHVVNVIVYTVIASPFFVLYYLLFIYISALFNVIYCSVFFPVQVH